MAAKRTSPASSRSRTTSKSTGSRSTKSKSSTSKRYTKPALRERLKEDLKASDKGGRKGQWSARKSQLLVQEYERKGGGYKGAKGQTQKSLEAWTDQKWQTKSGEARARHGKTTDRYLPKKAWDKLTPAERTATDAKKRAASRTGRQTVANTAKGKAARRSATKSPGAKA